MANDTRYPVPAREARVRTEVKGSRFIATADRVTDVAAARAFVARTREEFADATHNCWAWVVGPPGSTEKNASSDDGEPGGTAGLPILTALLNSGVGEVGVVVTRYFGGVKLGRGGLVRAYGGAARRVLGILPLTERVFYAPLRVGIDYAGVDAVRRLVAAHGGAVEGETFGERAELTVRIPEDRLDAFVGDVTRASGGKASVERRE